MVPLLPTAPQNLVPRTTSMDTFMLNISELPDEKDVTFKDSSFFTYPNSPGILPTPAEVRAAAATAKKAGRPSCRPRPVKFPSLNLIVKYGSYVNVAEGQCLWSLRRLLADAVPVPEVYGWCRDQNETFIFMELIQGNTLEDRWDELSTAERLDICAQLRHMIDSLHKLRQDPADRFIGSIARRPLLDVTFEHVRKPPPGPLPNVKSLHDYFVGLLPWRLEPGAPVPFHPMRQGLCDDQDIVFTHSDLHRNNILISTPSEKPPRVVAIIDWHQSGWYPAGWEWCKARLTAPDRGDWDIEYLPKFLTPWKEYNYHWDYFALALGV